MRASEFVTEAQAVKQRLDPKCRKGKHKEGTKIKGGVRVNNCVPNESVAEGSVKDINDIVEKYCAQQGITRNDLTNYDVKQLSKLSDLPTYYIRDQLIKTSPGVTEGEVVPFRRPVTQAQPSLPADILHLANEWFWANDDTNTLQAVTDQGYGQGAENLVKYIQAQLQTKGWTIDFDDEIDNIVLTNRSGQTVALPVADAYDETGWAKGTLSEEFDLIESIIENLAKHNAVDAEMIWEDLESLTDDELYVFAITQPIMEDLDEMDRRGFLKSMGAGAALAGASSLGANTAFAQSMPNINTQKLNLANKYYAALVQRAKEDGLPLDTRTKNMLKAKAEEMATRQLQQTQPQVSSYPGAQSSEIKRSNNYNQFESEAWQKANKKDKTDGMSRKAVKTYRREHPGSKLQTAVTTKPSKLKKGSKASKRRKSYCSRSKGQMKMHNISCAKTPDKAICKARRRWNC